MSRRIPLTEQAAEASHHAANMRGHREKLRELVKIGKRPEHELRLHEGRVPLAEAIASTLKILARHEDEARGFFTSLLAKEAQE